MAASRSAIVAASSCGERNCTPRSMPFDGFMPQLTG
jgi:hypothetical protein